MSPAKAMTKKKAAARNNRRRGDGGAAREIKLSSAAIPATIAVDARDDSGGRREVKVTGEYPLTLYADGRELVTLMTLGAMPEALALGWLRNQRLLASPRNVEEIMVDWEVNAAAVHTRRGLRQLESDRRTVTSGCGQGTVFGDMMAEVDNIRLSRRRKLSRAALWSLLDQIRERDTVYKESGAVHACALAAHARGRARILLFTEDVGRHNAVDAIAGWMWLRGVSGADKIFYTTGRLTSEMVIKCAQMRIPYLVSRSGLTRMGWEIGNQVGLTMFGRAVNRRYLLFTGGDFFAE